MYMCVLMYGGDVHVCAYVWRCVHVGRDCFDTIMYYDITTYSNYDIICYEKNWYLISTNTNMNPFRE